MNTNNTHEIWDLITKSFTENPRNVITVPLISKKGKWFYVICLHDQVYISSGKIEPKCKISDARELNVLELPEILDWYRKRKTNLYDSKKVQDCTYNSSYWYGIFNDLNIE